MDNVPEETHVVSVMTQEPHVTVAKVRDQKDDRLLLNPTQRQNRLTGDPEKPNEVPGSDEETKSHSH